MAQQSMPAAAKLLCIIRFEQIHDSRHFMNCVTSEFRPRAMRRFTLCCHLEPQAPFMSCYGLQACRFSDDCEVCLESAIPKRTRASLDEAATGGRYAGEVAGVVVVSAPLPAAGLTPLEASEVPVGSGGRGVGLCLHEGDCSLTNLHHCLGGGLSLVRREAMEGLAGRKQVAHGSPHEG